jgi:hypothetical protein
VVAGIDCQTGEVCRTWAELREVEPRVDGGRR